MSESPTAAPATPQEERKLVDSKKLEELETAQTVAGPLVGYAFGTGIGGIVVTIATTASFMESFIKDPRESTSATLGVLAATVVGSFLGGCAGYVIGKLSASLATEEVEKTQRFAPAFWLGLGMMLGGGLAWGITTHAVLNKARSANTGQQSPQVSPAPQQGPNQMARLADRHMASLDN